jgi:catalase-related immune-responsive protein
MSIVPLWPRRVARYDTALKMLGADSDPNRLGRVNRIGDIAYPHRAVFGVAVREVLDDVARERLAHNIIGHVCKGVKEPVLSRVFEYWRNVDPDLGKFVEEGVRANLGQ